jgi:hypothetical protein
MAKGNINNGTSAQMIIEDIVHHDHITSICGQADKAT